jgi:exosortase
MSTGKSIWASWRPAAVCAGVLLLGVSAYGWFFRQVWHLWWTNEEYSFGILIPFLVGYLLWLRREAMAGSTTGSWAPAVLLVACGSALEVLAARSGTLQLSGIALVLTILGAIGYLWGKPRLALCAGPIVLLLLMVPLPSYVMGEITWQLQSYASTVSGGLLQFLGIPVYQDGNLLRLPNYVLEVKQACSGSRSLVALLALACGIGTTMNGPVWPRFVLVIAAPCLAVGANIIRIVGTGVIARQWGSLAANEALHEAWGIAAFVLAVSGLLAMQSLIRGASCKNA